MEDCNTNIKIACLNARGIMASSNYISKVLHMHNIDIMAVSEHWLFPQSLSFLSSMCNDYVGWGVCSKELDPATSHHRGKGGLAFLFKKSLKHVIQCIDIDSDRIQGISVSLSNSQSLNIFSVYMPSSNASNVTYDEHIDLLYNVFYQYSQSAECIIMGDFNCDIPGDKCVRPTAIRSNSLCKLMVDINYVAVDNTHLCKGPNYTFDPVDDHSIISHIDHILIHQDFECSVNHCEILEEAGNPSDHLPIILSLNVPQQSYTESENTNFERKKLKWDKLALDQIVIKYTDPLKLKLQAIKKLNPENAKPDEISEYYDLLVKIMRDTAINGIPACCYKKSLKPFWNDNVKMAHKNMKAERLKWLQKGKPRNEDPNFRLYKESKHTFQRVFRQAKLQWELDEYNDIEQSAEINQKHFWALINKKRKSISNKCYSMKFADKECKNSEDILGGWESYFRVLYQPLNDHSFDDVFKVEIEDKYKAFQKANAGCTDVLDFNITSEEVSTACKQLKLNSAGGIDMLTNEHLIYGGSDLHDHLSCLFNCMLNTCITPKEMKVGLVVTILKPGKTVKSNPDNYRGITLLPVVYKLYEKVTLSRMVDFLANLNPVRPDPLQAAYQKKLSSINTSFCLSETIKYNLERGSKVFVCCLDAVKAFDTVWHCGLFTRLYEVGIKGLMWQSVINSYTDMYNIVLYNGLLSKPIPVLQSTRQGSFWGGWFYLLFIDPLIKHIRELGYGAHVMDLFVGILLQADDIALIAINKHCLDIMIKECFTFASKWRLLLHPKKSKILVYGEKKKVDRLWKVDSTIIDEVQCHVHCGVTLCTERSRISHTKDVCRKGRGIMLALLNSGLGQLNPITGSKLYKSIVIPSALYSCELWSNLSQTEKLMIERLQRFCSKCIQKLSRRARSDICNPMLGLLPLNRHIDSVKMNFLRRLLALPNSSVSKQLFLRRWFQYKIETGTHDKVLNFCSDISLILTHYNLSEYVHTFFFEELFIPDKIVWKRICKTAISNIEINAYDERTRDEEFSVFKSFHTDITDYCYLWYVGKLFPHKLSMCFLVAKYIAEPVNDTEILCEFCGRIFMDTVLHRILDCELMQVRREQFWCDIVNNFPCLFGMWLHNLDSERLIRIMFGAPLDDVVKSEVSNQDYLRFLVLSLDMIYSCIYYDKYCV